MLIYVTYIFKGGYIMQRNPYNRELKEKLKTFKKLRENATSEEKKLLDTSIDIIFDIIKSKPI